MTTDGMVDRGYSVRGRVQGVGFRWWTRRTAEELGLSGSVKNRRDGSVEVRVRGPEGEVERFRERLARGPTGARVDGIDVSESDLPVEDGAFRIVH